AFYTPASDGPPTQEIYYYLPHAHAVQPLKQVVLGLDTYHPTLAPATTRPDFDADLLDSRRGLATPSVLRADLKILPSLDTLDASVSTVRSQGDRRRWRPGSAVPAGLGRMA